MSTRALSRTRRRFVALSALLLLSPSWARAGGVYLEPAAFLTQAFGKEAPEAKTMWLNDAHSATAKKLLGHPYSALRVRYWLHTQRSAWILDEIGKEEPITVGIVISAGRIESIQVLEFRESRGDEVRHTFFTKRFKGAALTEQLLLDRHIDNITGASMSVRSLTKVATLALYFHEQVTQ